MRGLLAPTKHLNLDNGVKTTGFMNGISFNY